MGAKEVSKTGAVAWTQAEVALGNERRNVGGKRSCATAAVHRALLSHAA